jgi:hypothetical protein
MATTIIITDDDAIQAVWHHCTVQYGNLHCTTDAACIASMHVDDLPCKSCHQACTASVPGLSPLRFVKVSYVVASDL